MADWREINKRRITLVAKVGNLGAERNAALRRFEVEPTESHANAYREAKAKFDAEDARLRSMQAEFEAAYKEEQEAATA